MLRGLGMRPLLRISLAAELAGMHPQTLREYDRLGLVSPVRTAGRGRRYTLRDVEKLREIQRLSQEEGINLAGIKRILELEDALLHVQEELQQLRMIAEPGRYRVFAAGPRGEVVVTSGAHRVTREANSRAMVVWNP
ncbi:MerR family transcriptional regulator, heat shock protein HspR [Ruaniaceae bacterium KH17]|nr:MerR family transcriptional regulator, heat shock protein HspR [Ruaniaceae bacterium KH17]